MLRGLARRVLVASSLGRAPAAMCVFPPGCGGRSATTTNRASPTTASTTTRRAPRTFCCQLSRTRFWVLGPGFWAGDQLHEAGRYGQGCCPVISATDVGLLALVVAGARLQSRQANGSARMAAVSFAAEECRRSRMLPRHHLEHLRVLTDARLARALNG